MDLFVNYYKNLFSSEISLPPPPITSNQAIDCTDPPSLSELKDALFSMGSTKAPGEDGFHAIFFQHFWEDIKLDCWDHVTHAFSSKKIPESLNSTIVTLIPKIENPTRVTHFRPISLVNSSYKMITKILVNRIRPFLHDIISPNQNSFIPGRGPETNYIIATEIIHSMNKKKGKRGLFALKLDLEKAYDRLEWSFIEHCLLFFNFSSDSIRLIMSCVSSVSTKIQINGSRSPSFSPSRASAKGTPFLHTYSSYV